MGSWARTAARSALAGSHALTGLVEADSRSFVRALIAVQDLRLQAVEKKREALVSGPSRPSTPHALRVLFREYRAARRVEVCN